MLAAQRDDRLIEAGRIAQSEQLFRVMAIAGAAQFLGERHRKRERAAVKMGAAFAAAFACRFCHISHRRDPSSKALPRPK